MSARRQAIHIRAARPTDAPQIVAILQAALSEAASVQRVARLLREESHITFVATLDGNTVGFVDQFVVRLPQETRLELDLLAILPAAQRRGIGKKLVTYSKRWAMERGIARTRALVATGNASMQGLMRQVGFQSSMTTYVLMISDRLSVRADWCIPVDTFLYRGFWLEGGIRMRKPLSIHWPDAVTGDSFTVGSVIESAARDARQLLEAHGFEAIGTYHWWEFRLK